jgi:DNA-binding LytR/AlgR family response regulator
MNVVIIEDEAPAARAMQRMLKELNLSIEVQAVLSSVEQSITWFKQHGDDTDLIFSDIQLSDDLSFAIFDELKLNIPVVYTTAYDQYAIRAFKHFSIDYLIKPFDIHVLKNSVDKYTRMKAQYRHPDYKLLLNELKEKTYYKRFMVHSGPEMLSIDIGKIAYFYFEDGVSFMATKNKKKYLMYESLDSISTKLDPEKFYRVNRQFLVSIDSIASAQSYFNGKIKVILKQGNDKVVIVSKDKAAEFKKWMNM